MNLKKITMLKKGIYALMAMSMLLSSCSNDDDVTPITPNAGTLNGGPFTFFVDGQSDMVSGITTDPDALGTNRTFVITDDAGNILGTGENLNVNAANNYQLLI